MGVRLSLRPLIDDCSRYELLSAFTRQSPDKQVIDWLDQQPRSSIWTTSVTILEIRFGLQILPVGKRRSALIQAFDKRPARKNRQASRSFATIAAQQAGDLMAPRHKKGRVGALRDTMIAAIVLACHAKLATRNTSRFEGLSVPVVNPWAT